MTSFTLTEILAGIVLSQLVNPGSPVIYGSTSAPMDQGLEDQLNEYVRWMKAKT